MKAKEPDFFLQYTAVVVGTVLAVMTFAFICIPLVVDLPPQAAAISVPPLVA